MRVDYKIIWIEDYPDDMEVQILLIKKVIEDNFLIPHGLDEPYISYEDFEKRMLHNINKDKFVDCDLLLIDYNISQSTEDKKSGKDIIKKLREKGIYTDVIFYSGNMEELRKSIIQEELDAVTYSDNDKEKLLTKFEKVLEKQINMKLGISNIRGYLMDSTSDFDFISRNYVENFYLKLEPESKQAIRDKIKEFITEQKKNESRKFSDAEKIFDKDQIVKLAMDSVEYVMPVKDKAYIVGMILNFFDATEGTKDDPEIYSNDYDKKIIKPRNKLAHAKLRYGENDAGHIKIEKKLQDIHCDCANCTEENKYTKEQVLETRKNIYEYYFKLNRVLDSLIKEVNKV